MTTPQPQSGLDKRLDTILYEFDSTDPDVKTAREQIHQAYKDAGYVQVPETVEYWNKLDGESWVDVRHARHVKRDGVDLMTGKEWYERFEKQYHMSADWIAGDETMGDDAEHDVLKAARLAAGVSE